MGIPAVVLCTGERELVFYRVGMGVVLEGRDSLAGYGMDVISWGES